MKDKCMILVAILICLGTLLSAQTMWQDEAVLRTKYSITWNNSPLHLESGENYVLWSKGDYGNQGIFIHKFNNNGESVWDNDVLVVDNESRKSSQTIVSDSLSNIFVYWEEYYTNGITNLCVAKLNTNGQFLWQPQVVRISVGDMIFSKVQVDNQGGIYVVYGKMIPGHVTDLYCQHVSSDGQQVLPGFGIELTNDVSQEDIVFCKALCDNGLLIGYYTYLSSSGAYRKINIIRMTRDFQLVWQYPIVLSQSTAVSSMGNISSLNSNQFIATWSESGTGIANAYMQKIDLNGSVVFNPPILISNNLSNSLTHSIDSDGNIFVSNTVSGSIGQLSKYDSNGNTLWSNPVVLADSVLQMLHLRPDNQGGCFALTKHRIIPQNTIFRTRLQRVDSNGNLLFGNEGYLLEDPLHYDYNYSYTYSLTDRLFFFWINQYQDKLGFYCQVRDINGHLISTPRVTINEGIAGYGNIYGMVPRDNDLLIYWIDNRFENKVQQDKRAYYRTITPDGTMSLPVDGTAITGNIASRPNINCVYLPNGNTVFIWVNVDNGVYTIMGQSLDSNDNMLWEPGGRILTTTSMIYSNIPFIVSNEGNDIYIAWCMQTNNSIGSTYVQKISDGIPMWGSQGILINTELASGSYNIEKPAFFKNRYLVIQGSNNYYTNYDWVVHLEPDGSFSPGWQPNGYTVNSYICSFNDSKPVVSFYEDYLYVFNQVSDSIEPFYYYSVFNQNGAEVVDNRIFIPGYMNQDGLTIDDIDGLVFTLYNISYIDPRVKIGYGKLANLDTYPWGESTTDIYSAPDYYFEQNPSIIGFTGGGYLISWLENSTIYGCYVNAVGELQSPFNGTSLIRGCSDAYYTSRLGNFVYIAWKDNKAGFHSYYDREPRVQKIANPTHVGNNDNHITDIAVNSLVCFPNPFNPSTTISFELSKSEKATLRIYNSKGQLVKTLLDNVKSSGQNELIWNGRDDNGRLVSSGLYFYKLDTPSYNKTNKMILLK